MSRIQIIDASQMMLPNKCIICGSGGLSDGRKFVDFMLNFDYYGGVYICVLCYINGADKCGFHSQEEFDKLHVKYLDAMVSVKNLEEDNARYRAILDNVDFLAAPHSSSFAASVEDDFAIESESESSEKSSGSDAKSGLSDVSSDESDSANPRELKIKL